MYNVTAHSLYRQIVRTTYTWRARYYENVHRKLTIVPIVVVCRYVWAAENQISVLLNLVGRRSYCIDCKLHINSMI